MSAYAQSICPSSTSSVDTNVGREYFYEAKRLLTEGKYLQSKQLFKYVIQLRPDAASPHYHLGCALVELHCIQEAICHFKKAARLKPDVVKYKQFEKWYSCLYQIKYRESQTPGAPKQCISHNDDNDDDDRKSDDENFYDGNQQRKFLTHLSVCQLLNEFAPNTAEYRVKPNASLDETITALIKAIKLYDIRNNQSNERWHKYNANIHPHLNQKHLYQLLIHHKDILVKRRKQNEIKRQNHKNFKKHSNCRYCFAPLSVACEHRNKKTKTSRRNICEHKYHYMFE